MAKKTSKRPAIKTSKKAKGGKPAKASKKAASKPVKKAPVKKAPAKKASAKKAAVRLVSGPMSPAGEASRALDMLNWTHQFTKKLCSGFPDDKVTFQSSATDNHLMWQIGHMATAYSWFANMLDGGPVSLGEPYDKLFGYQSKPMADLASYPSMADVQRVHDEQFARLMASANKLGDADAANATLGDSGGFAKNKIDVLIKCAWHEGWHQGQISSLRRALAMPSAM